MTPSSERPAASGSAERRPRTWAHREAVAYRRVRREYAQATAALVAWLSGRLADIDEIEATVSGRTKDVRSVEHKLRMRERERPGRDSGFADLPDLIGARVVVRLESEIQIVADELLTHLAIDKEVDVREERGREETPGYRGHHFDVRALPGSELPAFLRTHPAEIQVRTRAADLWASVEHELRYKAREELPAARSRQFVLAASLLELAERELEDLRAWQVYRQSAGGATASAPQAGAGEPVLPAARTEPATDDRGEFDELALGEFLAGRYPAAAPSTPRRRGWMLELLREMHLDSAMDLTALLPRSPDRRILTLVEGRATADNVRMLDDELLLVHPDAYLKANRAVPDERNAQRMTTLQRRRRRLAS